MFRISYTIDKEDKTRVYAEQELLERVASDGEFHSIGNDGKTTVVLLKGGRGSLYVSIEEDKLVDAHLIRDRYEDLVKSANHYGLPFDDSFVEEMRWVKIKP